MGWSSLRQFDGGLYHNPTSFSTTIRWRSLPQFNGCFYHNSIAVSTTIRWRSLPQLDGGLYHNSRVAAASNCRCTCESQVCSCKCALCSDESSLPQQPPVRYINISRPYLRDKSWGRFSRGLVRALIWSASLAARVAFVLPLIGLLILAVTLSRR